MKRIAQEWNAILIQLGVRPTTAAIWSEIFAACITPSTFSAGDDDLRPFVAQVLHESAMLERLQENLNYSAERLMQVWPRRFPTLTLAQTYERSPEALANFVYGGRLGNRDPGDGWRYRGRGLIMVTGRDNYARMEQVSGLRLLANPDLLAQPLPALMVSIAWWEHGVRDAVLHDVEAVTLAVNGGTVGLAHRTSLTEAAGRVLA